MARTRTTAPQDIHAALRKLKDQSNAKEIELIELISNIYESIQEKQVAVVEKIEDSATVVNTSVHLHPWRYIGGAALCGFLAGFFFRR